jgi:16S rRNA (guanine1516-N2)-methyltransferase
MDRMGNQVVVLAEKYNGVTSDRCLQAARTSQLDIIDAEQYDPTSQLALTFMNDCLTLSDQRQLRIRVDFASGKSLHRLKYGGGSGQPLARAVKISGTSKPLICDATGGMGRDAFVFASLGCEVVMLEQSAIVYALLVDGLQRALKNPDVSEIAKRIAIHHINSKELPDAWPYQWRPDTLYLDPMYPHDRKKSAAKKEMQLLQRLTLDEPDEATLLQSAISTAVHRVAVKRPIKAPPLAGTTPSGAIKSTNTRYDIYAGQGAK